MAKISTQNYAKIPTLALLVPGDDVGPLNTVLRLSRNRRKSAQRDSGPWCVHVELALNAGRHRWQDHLDLAFET